MIRGTFANIRLRNQLAPGTEGGFTRELPDGDPDRRSTTPPRAYAEAGVPLVVLAGKEYGSGSSRDWAAKGTALLGVRAVIAESYERIHRSNLIGMGVLPLQFPAGRERCLARPDRRGDLRHHRRDALNDGHARRARSTRDAADGTVEFDAVVRIDTPGEADYYRNGGIMQYVLRSSNGHVTQCVRSTPGSPVFAAQPAVALLIGGILVVSFNLRAAITSLPPVFPELRHAAGLSTATLGRPGRRPGAQLRALLRASLRCSARQIGEERVSSWPWACSRSGWAALGRAWRAAVPGHDRGRRGDLAGQRAAAEPGQTAQAGAGRAADRPVPDVADRRGGIAAVIAVPVFNAARRRSRCGLTLGMWAAPALIAIFVWLPQAELPHPPDIKPG